MLRSKKVITLRPKIAQCTPWKVILKGLNSPQKKDGRPKSIKKI